MQTSQHHIKTRPQPSPSSPSPPPTYIPHPKTTKTPSPNAESTHPKKIIHPTQQPHSSKVTYIPSPLPPPPTINLNPKARLPSIHTPEPSIHRTRNPKIATPKNHKRPSKISIQPNPFPNTSNPLRSSPLTQSP